MTVTGSRSIEDVKFIFECLDDFLLLYSLDPSKLVLNSGHARGVDLIAESWAKERELLDIRTFLPEWKTLGKKAGMVRNVKMIDLSSHVCAIWDGQSTGTKGAIDYAKSRNKLYKVYDYKI